ncbi:dienelactone hydrolase family protein [Aneurinibacillus migulanus]|uniref:dienelactone hydrolase family protein n=1 Tax=Aneurinibacillus migulanus TaxID=47500 RepID=UPI0020A22D81|nr:dienelactone hydrolase family protein [Aneurinibacillus migulanus]MCP1359129.1 dienelactone hydrolase family protein [Aneurinibacillus migulanus]
MEKQDAAIILVHEIYGVNENMKYMIKRLSKLGIDIICPNLLHRETPYKYTEEATAYQNFVQNIGFESAVQQVNQVITGLKQRYMKVGVVGFSIGATIAWLCSENRMCDFVVGCYGSRIRNHTDIEPACPTLLLFPNEEKGFDVHTLIERLKKKEYKNLEIKDFPGVHGFIDSFSPNYHEVSASEALQCIDEFLQNHLNYNF